MTRILLYCASIIVFVSVSVWVIEQPGTIVIKWNGYEVNTSLGIMAVSIFILIIFSALTYRFWLFIKSIPKTLSVSWQGNRRVRGYQALTEGMVALAAGDPEQAKHLAQKAGQLLNEVPLTMLLSAQAAQLSGDDQAARRFFQSMTSSHQTEFLGLRGLINQAIKQNDEDEAVKLVYRAHSLRPDSDWVSRSLFELQTRKGLWKEAKQTMEEAVRHNHITMLESIRRRAIIHCEMSLTAMEHGDVNLAKREAALCLELDDTLVPATIILAEHYIGSGRQKKAYSLIEKVWVNAPHPSLQKMYCEAKGAISENERVKAFQCLAAFNPTHIQSNLAIAIAALEARLWGEARKYLEIAGGERPNAQVCRLMAELEKEEHGNNEGSTKWLRSASMADPDPAWVCQTCGNAVEKWSALCDNCKGFDTLSWRTPLHVA